HDVGGAQALPQLPPQRVGPRIAVWLEDRHHPPGPVEPGGGQRRGDLARMMGVVVDERGAASYPSTLEPTADAAEGAQGLRGRPDRQAELCSHTQRRSRVEEVVTPW